MDGYTLVDAAVAGVILISAFLAYARGFVREVLSIAGWVLATVVAFIFAPQAEPLVKEIPVVGEFLRDSCELAIFAAFAVVFAVALLIVSIFTPIFANIVQRSAIGSFDQALGFLFGVARGAILVAVAFVLYDWVVPAGQGMAMIDDSKSADIFEQSREMIKEKIPTEPPAWIMEHYEQLTGSCGTAASPDGSDA